MKWRVCLTRNVTESLNLEIAADTAEEANRKAIESAGRYGEKVEGWEVDDQMSDEAYLSDPDGTEQILAEQVLAKEEDGTTYYQIDGCWIEEKYICKRCLTATHAVEAEMRLSFGCYAGWYCDACWPKSGFRDAVDSTVRFDPMDAGEALYEEDY